MDKQIENRRSHNISRCDVWVYGNGRSRAVAWVLVVSQVFVRALCLRLCVWQCCWLGQIFFLGWGYFILHLYKGPGEKYSSSVWFTFLLANSRKERPLRTQVGDRRGHRPRFSLHSCCDMYVHYFWLHLLSVHVFKHALYVSKILYSKAFFFFISSEIIKINVGS